MSEKPTQGVELPQVDVKDKASKKQEEYREALIQTKTEHGMNYLKTERNQDLSSPDYIPEYIQGPLFNHVRDAHRLFGEFSVMEEQAVRGSKEQTTLAREKEKQVKRLIKMKEQLEIYKKSTLQCKEALGAMSNGTQDSNVFTNMCVFGGQSDVVDFDKAGNMLFSVIYGDRQEDVSVFNLNDMADVYSGGSPIITEPFESKMDIWSLAEETKANQTEGKHFDGEWMYKRLINDFTNKGANNTIGLAFADLAGENQTKSFAEQCPTLENLIELDVKVELKIYYQSRRPDLDESVILDCMQGKIYVNDRQVKEKHIFWGLDREQPRTHVRVTPLEVCRLPSDF